MPKKLKPPSRIETLTFPVFGISWFGNPGDGTSIVAYCGGGGSSKTGVSNSIVIQEAGDELHRISTGDQVGVALRIFQNPVSGKLWLIVAVGNKVLRYCPTNGTLQGAITLGDGEYCNALAVNPMADLLAVGCDTGLIVIYAIADDQFGDLDDNGGAPTPPLFTCLEHKKTVCALAFSARGGRLLSSAKDGTACVWVDHQLAAVLRCTIEEGADLPKGKKPIRRRRGPPQIIVRGCAFGDLEGRLIYTIASAGRGKSFIAKWIQEEEGFRCIVRTECSENPVSAMSLSEDGGLMAMGSTDGTIILWGCENWQPLKVFPEVHDLPVTCIAARPFPVPLQGEDDGVQIHSRSASADNRLGCLTLQKRSPQRSAAGGILDIGVTEFVHRLISLTIVSLLLYPVVMEARSKCEHTFSNEGIGALGQCLIQDVIIAPSWKPGIIVPPY